MKFEIYRQIFEKRTTNIVLYKNPSHGNRVVAADGLTDRQTDRRDEGNSRVLQFCEKRQKSDSFTYYLLTYLFTYLLITYLVTYLLTYYLLTQLLTYLLITYLLNQLLTYLLTYLLTQLLTYILTYLLTYLPTY